MMKPFIRKSLLTAHITSSVGWFGAVAGWLALAITALSSQDAQLVRAVDLSMELTAWFVIVPLAFAALVTGIVQSLGTAWGLFRHYWVLAKLLLTVFATIVLLTKMGAISRVAAGALAGPDLLHTRIALVVHAGGGLLVLLMITALSVFKPWGRTRHGRQMLQQERPQSASMTNAAPFAMMKTVTAPLLTLGGAGTKTLAARFPLAMKIVISALFVILFVALHLAGGVFLNHGH